MQTDMDLWITMSPDNVSLKQSLICTSEGLLLEMLALDNGIHVLSFNLNCHVQRKVWEGGSGHTTSLVL